MDAYRLSWVCTNKLLIGGLIGAHVSSIVKWGYQGNFKPVYFFLRKDFARTKTPSQAKMNQQNKNKLTLNKKGNNFSRTPKLLRRWKSFVLRLVIFVRLKPFRKKINKQAWNCPSNLILLYYFYIFVLTC